jgi:hypothetical protein
LELLDDLVDRGMVSVELHLARAIEENVSTGESLKFLLEPLKVLQKILHAIDETSVGAETELLHDPLKVKNESVRK